MRTRPTFASVARYSPRAAMQGEAMRLAMSASHGLQPDRASPRSAVPQWQLHAMADANLARQERAGGVRSTPGARRPDGRGADGGGGESGGGGPVGTAAGLQERCAACLAEVVDVDDMSEAELCALRAHASKLEPTLEATCRTRTVLTTVRAGLHRLPCLDVHHASISRVTGAFGHGRGGAPGACAADIHTLTAGADGTMQGSGAGTARIQ